MSRVEETHQKALEKYKGDTAMVYISRGNFKSGAEWADKHPKRYNQDELCDIQLEMMKQRDKRLIEKACKWLKENIDTYAKVVINPKSHYPEIVMCDTFEKNFKKVMNE